MNNLAQFYVQQYSFPNKVIAEKYPGGNVTPYLNSFTTFSNVTLPHDLNLHNDKLYLQFLVPYIPSERT
jgi:hypothetical protein